jgi:hypothetical protein
MLARLKPVLTPPILISIGAVLLGILCVILAEYGDMHWIRLVGAILISGGGTSIGIYTGLADPRMLRIPRWLRLYRVTFALIATALIVLPALAVLVGALVGLLRDTDASRSTTLLALGTTIALLMLAATLVTAAVSVRAVITAGREQPRPSGERVEAE